MTTPCKGCGRPIRWAVSPSGADLPLEEVYAYWLEPGVAGARTRVVRADAPVWISHFLTCKDRGRFSGAERRRADG
jgi:hypothetical protein